MTSTAVLHNPYHMIRLPTVSCKICKINNESMIACVCLSVSLVFSYHQSTSVTWQKYNLQLLSEFDEVQHVSVCMAGDNSSASLPMVGTVLGSKAFTLSGSIGTHTRPVLGCTTKGDFRRWFICLLTLISSLGKITLATESR